MSAALRALPSIEKFAQELAKDVPLSKPLLVGLIQRETAAWRTRILEQGETPERSDIEQDIRAKAQKFATSRLRPVINATGVCIHTNLGRSPLGSRSAGALQEIATGYCNLEFDLDTGNRGQRAGYLETALATMLQTGAATAVNNCAAALVLTIRHLIAGGRDEVIVSRGELVEIGGGFRIPEVIETSGARLVEVGATNKVHLADYEKAITEKTGLILKVHRSNFTIEGFTAEPATPELAELAKNHGIPLVEDLGSGALMQTDQLAPLDHEPTPMECLDGGIDLVLFSGDKLLGGPQAGIIAGRADLVAGIKKEPFFRAVRCDKLILTVLQECIDDYLATRAGNRPDVPVLGFLATEKDAITARCEAVVDMLTDLSAAIDVVDSTSNTGGGTMPKSAIPSSAIRIRPSSMSVEKLAATLRQARPALVGTIYDDALHLDLRTVFPAQDRIVTEILQRALAS